jgi:hypothetical protein
MTFSVRRWGVGAVAVLALAGGPAVLVTIAPSGTANADVCASVGRRVSVSVMPQDAYAPIAPNASACVGWNGRWVNANSCT